MDSRVRDIRGQKFGKLTVLERVADHVTKSGKKLVTWKCKCDCGKECIVKSTSLKSGNTTSCGCVREKLRHQKRDLIPNKNAQNFIGERFVFLKVEEEINNVDHADVDLEDVNESGPSEPVAKTLNLGAQPRGNSAHAAPISNTPTPTSPAST